MADARLDKRLRALHPELSWARARTAIAGGQVLVAGRVERDAARLVPADAVVTLEVDRPRQPHARLDLTRLHEDAEILVVDKPPGLLTIPTDPSQRDHEDTVLGRVRRYAEHLHGRRAYAGVLHRLDRDTSGALALALTREAHAAGRDLFAAHAFEREYIALVHGVPAARSGRIDRAVSREYADGRRRLVKDGDDGRDAVTHYQVEEAFGAAALVRLRLETGRQHQIRLHLEALGHPLLGEQVYTGADAVTPRLGRGVRVRRQMLHAWRLAFPHPLHGTPIAAAAPLPEDFMCVLERLRLSR